MDEFNLIDKYFVWDSPPHEVVLSVGDDAAILDIPDNKQLVTSIDTLISGVHFPHDTPPDAIGHKALAVNLSDLAAMGATSHWFTLALTLPEIEKKWLEGFSVGLKSLAQEHSCFLVGGDTTRGPLSITIQVMGWVDKGKALLRSGAKAGDKIYVTGTLGDANAGLDSILKGSELLSLDDRQYCEAKLNYPTPRLIESEIIKKFASSCIDLSDGLLQDLSHILKASKVGAEINLAALPFSSALKTLDQQVAEGFALAGGDDYELLFTVSPENELSILKKMDGKVSCIGIINNNLNQILDKTGQLLEAKGYNHFHVRA